MNYLLMICSDGVATPEKAAAMEHGIQGWLDEMDARGVHRLGHALAPASTAVTVRVRDGETLLSDGPFAETKEFIGGFDVITCDDLDEAIEIAAKHPVSRFHSVEVRPFRESAGPNGPPANCVGSEVPDNLDIGAPAAGRQRYMLVMCLDGIPGTDEEEASIGRDLEAWLAEVTAAGSQVYGHAVRHKDTATTVRVRDGQTVISDGPFVETKEFVGGFDIVDCATREDAIQLAAAHPLARFHMVEVRAFADDEPGRS